jgi:hypothetical protein
MLCFELTELVALSIDDSQSNALGALAGVWTGAIGEVPERPGALDRRVLH